MRPSARLVNRSPTAAPLQRLVIAACALLMVYVATTYVLALAGVPNYIDRIVHGQVPTLITGGDSDVSNAIMAQEAARRGLSLGGYAVYSLVLQLVVFIVFGAAAALVLWGHGGDWFRWLTALFLFFFSTGGLYTLFFIGFPSAFAYFVLGGLLWPMFGLIMFLFPDGRAPARWMVWPMAALIAGHAFLQFGGLLVQLGVAFPLEVLLLSIFDWLIPVLFLYVALCQVYRYVRVAGPVERKQIQWFVAALVFVVVSGPVLGALAGGEVTSGDNGYLEDLDSLTLLALPAAIVIAILRYHLWDIDVIIRRTLIYSVLTATLALAYFGSVVVLQNVFRFFTGQDQSTLIVVLSTLAIAALFVPVRRRVQALIDRRFYRRKYDAAQTLAGFAASTRDETDLDRLSAQLVGVIDDTMQPQQVSLWLRPARRAPASAPGSQR